MTHLNKIFSHSKKIIEKSKKVFPGGVNSPVRSFASVGGDPLVFSHGEGKNVYDVDNNCFTDFCSSWGPLILGYSHPKVIAAVQEQARQALSFGAPSVPELLLGEKIKEWVSGIDLLRFVNSGTEATMSALRAARAATGRSQFLKFEGCYHGHADPFLVKAGSGLATLGYPNSAGVPQKSVEDTFVVPYNCIKSVTNLFDMCGDNIAAIIIEPIAANMGLVLPQEGFLKFIREITKKHNSILIFDEVMTGFRVARGGCAELFGVQPDLWTFGKIIGGGLPAAAYGGKKEIMETVAPLGPAYQAGTLSGNPLAMAAGLATLCEMEHQNAFQILEELGQMLDNLVEEELSPFAETQKFCYVRLGSFFCFFFGTSTAPQNFIDVTRTKTSFFNKVYHEWLKAGVYLGPSSYEVGFLSTCIELSDLEKLVGTIKKVFSEQK